MPARLEPVLHNKRSHRYEKPVHRNEEEPPLSATREEHARSNKGPTQPKINKLKKKKEKKERQALPCVSRQQAFTDYQSNSIYPKSSGSRQHDQHLLGEVMAAGATRRGNLSRGTQRGPPGVTQREGHGFL